MKSNHDDGDVLSELRADPASPDRDLPAPGLHEGQGTRSGLLHAPARGLQRGIRAPRLRQASAGREDRAPAHDPPLPLQKPRETAEKALREQPPREDFPRPDAPTKA